MKNKQILSFALAGLILFSQTSPLLATTITDENEATTLTSEVQTTDGAINITAANTKGQGIEGLEFKVIDAAGRQLQFVNNNDSYEVTSNGYYKTVTTDANGKIKLSHLEDGSYTIIYTKSNPKYVTTSDSTVSVNGGTVTTNIQVRENIGSMVFTLAGEDGSAIKNAKFVIKDSEGRNLSFSVSNGVYSYSENGSEALETNIAGKFTVERLPVGTYTLVQTESPVEYNGELITRDFTISLDSETKVAATSTKHYGSVSISVIDSQTSDSLKGSEFNILDSNGNKIAFNYNNGEYIFTREGGSNVVKTSNNGSCLVSGLPVGDYTLKQTTTPRGYDTSTDKTFSIVKNETAKVTVNNVKSIGNLEIYISDEKTEEGIKDYSFKVTDLDDKEIKFTKESDGVYTVGGDVIDIVSDANGKITVKGLAAGKYKIMQTKASSGYVIDKTAVEQEIISQQTTTYNVKASKTNVALSVVNEDNEALQGIKVQIVDKDNKVVLEGETTEGGKFLLADLTEGDYSYTLSNIQSPYMNMKYKGTFSIDEKGEVKNLKECVVKYNEVIINLNDSIEGAKFELVNKNDETDKYIVETDSEGKAVISKLEDGTYVLTQTEAPEGYEVAKDSMEIVIDRDTDKSITVKITNEVIGTESNDNNTENPKSIPSILFLVGGMVVMILGAVAYALWKTKDEKDENKEKDENNTDEDRDTEEIPVIKYDSEESDIIPETDVNILVERPDIKELNEDPYNQEEKEEKTEENRKPDIAEIKEDPYKEEKNAVNEGDIIVTADNNDTDTKTSEINQEKELNVEKENKIVEGTTVNNLEEIVHENSAKQENKSEKKDNK